MRSAAALRRRLRALLRDRRGASVIELALFAPILAVMVMGVADVAMGYARKIELEQAAYRALEKVAVGTTRTDYQFLKAEAAAAAGVPESAVTVDNWLECDGARQTDFGGACAEDAMVARYVEIRIAHSYTPSFSYGPLAAAHADSSGNIPVSAAAALRIQ